MKHFLSLIAACLLFSCSIQSAEWTKEWSRHKSDFKKVVMLMKKDKLVPSGTFHIIPDSIHLEYPCNQRVYKLDDQNNLGGVSCLFTLDTAQRAYRKNPVLVYTTNKMRQEYYEKDFKDNVVKIEKDWYFLYN